MNKIIITLIVVLLAVLAGAGYYFFGPPSHDKMVIKDVMQRISNPELSFSFAFDSGETALSSIESTPEQFGEENFLKMYVLMKTADLNEYQNGLEGRTLPPAISVLVFQRTEADKMAEASSTTAFDKVKLWSMNNAEYTNIDFAVSDIEEVEIDGAPTAHYKADKNYPQEVYVTKYGDKMYLFVGQYEEEGDYMHNAFKAMVESVYLE